MLLRAFLPRLITLLIASIFVAAGIVTFGDALVFDRIFIGVLVFTLVVCRKDINVVGVVVIIGLQRIVEEAGWLLIGTDYDIAVKVLFYAFAAWACYFCWYDKVSRLLLACLIITLCSELYWLLTEAKSTSLRWMIFIIALDLLVRDFIFYRVSYTEDFIKRSAKSINLDWHIYNLNLIAIAVQSALLIEAVLWSVFDFKAADYMYTATPYFMQVLATYAIWIIFNENNKVVIPKLLKA